MYGINPLEAISHEKYAEYWHIINLGESIYYLSSETVPIYASQEGITPFYQHYLGLCNFAWLPFRVIVEHNNSQLPYRVVEIIKTLSIFANEKVNT